MRKRSELKYSALVVAVSVFVACGAVHSQPNDTGARPRAGLDMVVTDAAGKPVTGLSAQDFTLLDKGKPQKILTFHPMNEVLSGGVNAITTSEVMILIDTQNTRALDTDSNGDRYTENTGQEYVAYERQQVGLFLRKNNGQLPYPVSVLIYGQNGAKPIAPPSRDGNALAAVLEKTNPTQQVFRESQAYYGAVERMQLSLKTLGSLALESAQRPGRKVLIWISPGWPILQATEAETNAKQSKALFSGIVTVSTTLRQARMSVYAIDPNRDPGFNSSGWFRYTGYVKPVTRWKDATVGNMALQVVAEQSGGLAINGTDQVLSDQIARYGAEGTSGYLLSFEVAAGSDSDEYHDLKVTVDKPGLKVRARSGYYAQP